MTTCNWCGAEHGVEYECRRPHPQTPVPPATPTRDEAVPTDAERFIASFTPKTSRDAMAMTLFKAWVKADPKNIVSEYPASYLANFVDMADAVLASAPAPASGGVDADRIDAMFDAFLERYDAHDGCPSVHDLADYLGNVRDAVRSALSPAATPVSEADLDARMKAAGMIPLSDLISGNTPLERWAAHTGVSDLDTFEQWLTRKQREFGTIKAGYELGDKDKDDELYEWVLSHFAAFNEVAANLRQMKERIALAKPALSAEHDPFARLLEMIEALPDAFRPSDEAPLRDHMPEIWPTVGDLRGHIAALAKPASSPAGGDDLGTFDAWFATLDTNVIESMSRRSVASEAWHHVRRSLSQSAAGSKP